MEKQKKKSNHFYLTTIQKRSADLYQGCNKEAKKTAVYVIQ